MPQEYIKVRLNKIYIDLIDRGAILFSTINNNKDKFTYNSINILTIKDLHYFMFITDNYLYH